MIINPILEKYNNEYEAIPFDQIKLKDIMPAIKYSLKKAYEALEKISINKDEADFYNTIEAIEYSSDDLDRTTNVYFNLYSLESDDDFKALASEISPLLAKLSADLYTNDKIFQRVKYLYDKSETLDLSCEEKRLLEKTYISFTRNGALLNNEDKEKLKKIDEELSVLSPLFSKNNLDATNSFELHITDKKRVKGIPENALSAASHTAKEKGYSEGWLFSLQMPSYLPVMQYADDRILRKEMSQAYGVKNLEGDFDNREIILKTVRLKHKRAKLLGYSNHSQYVLERRMAGNEKNVFDFMDNIFKVSHPAAKRELAEVKKLAEELDGITDFQSWDFSYYSEKLKQKKYAYNSEELRPYFKSENVIDGIFNVAEKMYGIKFENITNIPLYNNDVKTYKVLDSNKSYLGLLYVDLYPRKNKQGGAWMNTFRTQGLESGDLKRPHILISGNLTPSTPDTPSLLSFDEVNTIFHEFGHALHGLFSDVKYKSLASPNVYWDFVELPSQIMENWLLEKETLKIFAKHYKTGEIIPSELIDKVRKSRTFNAGYQNNRQLSLGYLDMAWHTTNPQEIEDVVDFEDKIMEKTRLLPKNNSNTSTVFSHIFAGGYSSGYYSYKWAEVLDADAFEYFKENGIFNKKTAASFRKLLSKGNTVDPMVLYKEFRGKEPDPNALLRRDGLI